MLRLDTDTDTDSGTPPPNRVELISAAEDVAVVSLIGEHDIDDYDSLEAVLARAAARAPSVVVDLSECRCIDATTIGLLHHASRVMTRYGGAFAVVVTPRPGPLSRLAEFARLTEMMSVHASLEAAMASVESRRFSDFAS
jgi:anti-anti-sigma factor